MRVRLNGDWQTLPEGATAADAAAVVGVRPGDRGVAVAVDGAVVPAAGWGEVVLAEGCTVEVVRAAAGG
ncbi:MAG: sulfur carrier protein ThiS [Miltoncostaeaceae bacterium]